MVRKIRLVPFGKKPAFPILTTYRYIGNNRSIWESMNSVFKRGLNT
jgi:hypothetical protein